MVSNNSTGEGRGGEGKGREGRGGEGKGREGRGGERNVNFIHAITLPPSLTLSSIPDSHPCTYEHAHSLTRPPTHPPPTLPPSLPHPPTHSPTHHPPTLVPPTNSLTHTLAHPPSLTLFPIHSLTHPRTLVPPTNSPVGHVDSISVLCAHRPSILPYSRGLHGSGTKSHSQVVILIHSFSLKFQVLHFNF